MKNQVYQVRLNKIGWKNQKTNFHENCVYNMGRKLGGKDGLNTWVTNFKENWVNKLVGKWVQKCS